MIVLTILVVLLSFFLMEGIAWFVHKYIMHGFLWFLHKDHHQPTPGIFQKNDTFFLIFAIPGWLLIMFGLQDKIIPMAAAGFGISLYGLAYFLVHDVIIHQRFSWFKKSNNSYILTIRRAHKIHHKQLEKENGESFGMLVVHKKYFQLIKRDRKKTAQLI